MTAAGLMILTAVVFVPSVNSDFVRWDDPDYVIDNKLLRDGPGLRKIWNPREKENQQYYPLVFTTYWLEYQAWGADARGYHVTNLVLHATNVVLVFALLLRCGFALPVAAGAAAVFALHPTQVPSVLWVAQRKNTLSTVFYLAAFLLYLRHRRQGSWPAYGGCLLAFGAALLSKTQTVTLPLSLLAADWMLQAVGRLRRASLAPLAARILPLLVIGLFAVRNTAAVERERGPRQPPTTPAQRPLIAANAAWFYAGTFVAPVRLVPIYPLWNVVPTDPRWWLGLAAWPAALWAVLRTRRRLGPAPLWGLAHFFIALTPVLGLMPFNYLQFSLVADHYLYLPCIGGGLVLAVLLFRLAAGPTASSRRRSAVSAVGIVLLSGCAVQSYLETRHWRDTEAFFRRTLARNPDCFPANLNLGNWYRRQGRWTEALPLYRGAARLRPDSMQSFSSMVDAVARVEGVDRAVDACSERLRQAPGFYRAHMERAQYLTRLGRTEEAKRDYEAVLRLAPQNSISWDDARRKLEGFQFRPRQR